MALCRVDATVRAVHSRLTVTRHRVLDAHATTSRGLMLGTRWLRRDATAGSN